MPHFQTNYEGKATYVDLSQQTLLENADMNRPLPLLPAGKACLMLAAKHYDFLMASI